MHFWCATFQSLMLVSELHVTSVASSPASRASSLGPPIAATTANLTKTTSQNMRQGLVLFLCNMIAKHAIELEMSIAVGMGRVRGHGYREARSHSPSLCVDQTFARI